jgi:hypothetical protein
VLSALCVGLTGRRRERTARPQRIDPLSTSLPALGLGTGRSVAHGFLAGRINVFDGQQRCR